MHLLKIKPVQFSKASSTQRNQRALENAQCYVWNEKLKSKCWFNGRNIVKHVQHVCLLLRHSQGSLRISEELLCDDLTLLRNILVTNVKCCF